MAMKVRQLVPSTGPGGRGYGEEYELDNESAQRLADAGHVVILATKAKAEPKPAAEPKAKAESKPAAEPKAKAESKPAAEQPRDPEKQEATDGESETAGTAGADSASGETGGDSEQPPA